MHRTRLVWIIARLPLDFLMLGAAGLAAYALRVSPWVAEWRPVLFALELPFEKYFALVLLLAVAGLAFFAIAGLYAPDRSRSVFGEALQATITVSAGFMGLVLYVFVSGELFNSRFIFLSAWLLALTLVSAGRIFLGLLERWLARLWGVGSRRILVIGKDALTRRIIEFTRANPGLGAKVLKTLAEPDIAQVRAAIGNPGIEEVILADPNYPREKVLELVDCCNDLGLVFQFVPNLFQTLTVNVGMEIFGDVPLIELKRTRLEGWGSVVKRVLDVLGAIVIGIVMLPVFLPVAFLIKWDSAGPVFVRLKRISQGKKFNLFKFRSMRAPWFNTEDAVTYYAEFRARFNERAGAGPLFKMRPERDPRVTRVGRFLRRAHLDEFAQLINVFKGDMSLVGPRPHEPEEVAQYEKHHLKVLAIRPGITGLAQVSGASELPFEDEVRLDTYYVEQWSLGLDVKILFKTLGVFLRGDRAAA